MNITFTSEIKHGGDKQDKIEFTSPVTTRYENGFRIFEFLEPSNNIMNWIEVAETMVNIITGPATINLMLESDLNVEYPTPAGLIYFTSRMHEIKIEEKEVNFRYSLFQGKNEIGEYKITLTLSGQ